MDWMKNREAVREILKKYGWAFMVLLAGLFLMGLPERSQEPEAASAAEVSEETDLSHDLERILSQLQGAGKVSVLLTQATGPVTHYQTDQDQSRTDTASDIRQDTVIVTGADRSQVGLIHRVDPPVYLGAVVLCQGADSASVRLAVVDAVGKATGLTADKISVLKMN